MYNEAIGKVLWMLEYVPDHLWMQEMCKRVVEEKYLHPMRFIPDHFKTQEMCEKVDEEDPWLLRDDLDHLKTQEMRDDAVGYYPYSLQHVPDWFVTHQKIRI